MRGNNLGKMVKSCMKITKSAFLGQNNVGGEMGRGGGGGSGKANFLGSSRGIPPVTPTRGNPAFLLEVHSLFRYRSYRWNYIQRFSIYD